MPATAPPHPGELLRDEVIAALGLSVTEAASRLAMSRVALSRVLNGKAAISPDLALRLEQAGTSTARVARHAGELRSLARTTACAASRAPVAGNRVT